MQRIVALIDCDCFFVSCERVRRAIGPEQADRILEAAYQQEQVEKERKWGARSKMRVGAR